MAPSIEAANAKLRDGIAKRLAKRLPPKVSASSATEIFMDIVETELLPILDAMITSQMQMQPMAVIMHRDDSPRSRLIEALACYIVEKRQENSVIMLAEEFNEYAQNLMSSNGHLHDDAPDDSPYATIRVVYDHPPVH